MRRVSFTCSQFYMHFERFKLIRNRALLEAGARAALVPETTVKRDPHLPLMHSARRAVSCLVSEFASQSADHQPGC